MKIWIEHPESTRFAKATSDVLYTPIYFANEGISGFLKLDPDWQSAHALEDLDAKVKLIGRASLGYLSVGGRPSSGLDTQYQLVGVGFRPIYTLHLFSLEKKLSLTSDRTPFLFHLPTSTLDDLQQLSSSLKVISADTSSNVTIFTDTNPALIIYVRYVLAAEVHVLNTEITGDCNQEIRIFISLSREQVPSVIPSHLHGDTAVEDCRTQIVQLGKTKASRRQSIPFVRRLSRSSSAVSNSSSTPGEEQYVLVEAEQPEPFTFQRSNDAAATRLTIRLTYNGISNQPGDIVGDLQWMLKSTTSLAFEPAHPQEEGVEPTDDYFHLRAKVLPFHRVKMRWTEWVPLAVPSSRVDATETTTTDNPSDATSSSNKWTSVASIYLTRDLKAALSPSFATSYLSHLYTLRLALSLTDSSSKLSRLGLSSNNKVILLVPVAVRYELGLAPGYEIDESLPGYDHSLPHYEDAVSGQGSWVRPRGDNSSESAGQEGESSTRVAARDMNENARQSDDLGRGNGSNMQSASAAVATVAGAVSEQNQSNDRMQSDEAGDNFDEIDDDGTQDQDELDDVLQALMRRDLRLHDEDRRERERINTKFSDQLINEPQS